MKYEEFLARSAFSPAELLAFGAGRLVEDAPPLFAARLPLPPMLMIDRITDIRTSGSRGSVVAERAVSAADWFFACHFAGDPVQPGCLGVDAVWQMLGFYCAWRGGLGAGRALGCGQIAFDGQIRPDDRMVRYEVEVRRCTIGAAATLSIADAVVFVDDRAVYTLKDARVGLFPELAVSRAASRDAGASHGVENDGAESGSVPDFAIGEAWAEARL
jgi:3-hydroxyacyl-[acyl-carrier protein] dehydratase/trans-2-decenoyl-[acyl-carrier protein] isomerase